MRNPQGPLVILPVGVVGCGRMGRLHARTYAQMPHTRLVGVFDAISKAAETMASEFGTKVVAHLDELAEMVSAVTIAVPTEHHAKAAEPFLKRGLACLIEKPLAKDSAEGKQIVQMAARHGAMLQVGHIERFNPAVVALAKLNLSPRYLDALRVSPLPFRSLDVGVVLDVMIHDIDIVLSLIKSPVKRVDAVGVSVIGGVEDICNARLTFENGCVANLTASRLALKTERKLRVFCPDAYVSIDYQKKTGVIAHRNENVDAIRSAVESLRQGQGEAKNFADLVKLTPLAVEDVDQIRAELEAFVGSIRQKQEPVVSGEQGLAAVELAERIVSEVAASQ
ncbi:MAG TPA: Gfo/Idh/MocA family oxidoreductase [Tepidisphaeraceae bacterium]|jgi:predicted dehydrogenase|nr:Gfo/Idh/MocA family oxidoreductase [Tepidisphaeraceae bacterium]